MKSFSALLLFVTFLFLLPSSLPAAPKRKAKSQTVAKIIKADRIPGRIYSVSDAQDTISGTVYNDDNRNGIDDIENGLEGWTVVVHADSITGTLVASTETDADGNYSFVIDKGTYVVFEVGQPGWQNTDPPDGFYLISDNDTGIVSFSNQNFGNFEFGRITIQLTEDVLGDSVINDQDTSALPSGVKAVFQTKRGSNVVSTDTLGDSVKSVTIHTRFIGNYTITQITKPAGWIQTLGQATARVQTTGVLDTAEYMDFKLISVDGNVFNDLNNNGIDNSEPALTGWTVRLHRDTVINPVIASTVTDGSGNFHISVSSAGTYVVDEVVQSGWFQDAPSLLSYYKFTAVSGGTFSANAFGNIRAGSISGTVYFDKNKNGVKDPDEPGLTGWHITATNANPALTQSAVSQPGGVFTVQNLVTSTYTLTEAAKTGWTNSDPLGGSYTIAVNLGRDTAGFVFGNQTFADSFTYRSFTPDSFSLKALRKKNVVSSWSFNLVKPAGLAVNGVHIVFNKAINTLTDISPFRSSSLAGKRDWVLFNDTLNDGDVVHISGTGSGSGVNITKWWFMYNGTVVGKKQPKVLADTQRYYYPMPNAGNVRDLIFAKGFAPFNITPVKGMLLGVVRKDSARAYGWVVLSNSTAVQNSLLNKSGFHTGSPAPFSTYNGRSFAGQKSSIDPGKLNDRLVADLIALKLNIAASAYNITPPGYGELVYEEGANPMSGKMLKDIAGYADTVMTNWRSVDPSVYTILDTTIAKINLAFYGASDTLSFHDSLNFTGVRPVSAVSFLRPTPPGIAPRIIYAPNTSVDEEVPKAFALYQNYPNPFNPTTTISYALPNPAFVTIKVYNMLGQEVATLLNREQLDAGEHAAEFAAQNLASGVYFYRIAAEEIASDETGDAPRSFVSIKKMVLVK